MCAPSLLRLALQPVTTPTKRLPNERDLHLGVGLVGVIVTLCDDSGEVVMINVTGLRTDVDMFVDRVEVGAR